MIFNAPSCFIGTPTDFASRNFAEKNMENVNVKKMLLLEGISRWLAHSYLCKKS